MPQLEVSWVLKGVVFPKATSTALSSNRTGDAKDILDHWMVQPLAKEGVPCHEVAGIYVICFKCS